MSDRDTLGEARDSSSSLSEIDDMRRRISAALVGLILVPQLMTGCKNATEPEWSDDGYSRWVGSWVGTSAAHQISVQVRRGDSYRACVGFYCHDYSDLYYTATFSDAVTGYSGGATAIIRTADRYGLSDDLEFDLLIKEVTGSPGVALVVYTYRGTLQGAGLSTGNVVLNRFSEVARYSQPISTESFEMTLRKQ
jgi:hypothetical protein